MIRYCKLKNKRDFIEECRYWGIPVAENIQIERFLSVPLLFCKDYSPEIGLKWREYAAFHRAEVSYITQNGEKDSIFLLALHLPDFWSQARVLSKSEDEEFVRFRVDLGRLFDNLNRSCWTFKSRGRELRIEEPLIMGILNITPDSFSDGGLFFSREKALEQAEKMICAGADIIDIGGESTRPGAEEVTAEEEWARIGEVVGALAQSGDCIVSVDTYKSEVARRALESGAHLINDISAFSFDPGMADVVARFNVPAILMHIQGTPRNMQKNPVYKNLMFEIVSFLQEQCGFGRSRGVHQLIVDPGLGFGKRPDDNFEILRRLNELTSLGYPILIGPSRKSFIGRTLKVPENRRLPGTLTSVVASVLNGAKIVRVHDVAETRQCLRVLKAIRENKES